MHGMMNAAEEVERICGVDANRCMRCGKCSASCPAFEDMDLHPQKIVAMVCDGDMQGLMKSNSLWRCLACFQCVERCPRDVKPANVIEAVRLLQIRESGANHMTPDDIPAMLDDELPQQAIVAAMRKYSK